MKLKNKRHVYEVRNEYVAVTKKLDMLETKFLYIVYEGTQT